MQQIFKTTKLAILALLGLGLVFGGVARGQTYTNNVNSSISDGNPVGLASTTTVSGLTNVISSIQVNLDITGGFNGDLYAYLLGPQGGFAVLLNRVGMSSANPFSYSDAGFNITLSSGAPNIHSYLNVTDPLGGQLTGTWAPDGRNISPGSAPSVFDTAGTSANFDLFASTIPNGDWTLFIADLGSGGGQSTLVSWGLTIVTVPEPQTWMLIAGGFGALLATRRFRK
ncbi:MAG: PEP-CTERM sorting domain-containing protein [Verrucomicrobiota bacterium]